MILFGNGFVYDSVKDVTDNGCVKIVGDKWMCVVDSSFILTSVGYWINDGVDFFAHAGRYYVKRGGGYYFYMVLANKESVDVENTIWGRYVTWKQHGRHWALVVDVVDYVMWDDLSKYLFSTMFVGWGIGKWDDRYERYLQM